MIRIAAVAFSVLSVTTAIGACTSATSGAGTPAGGNASPTTAPRVVTRVTRGEFASSPSGGGGYSYDTELVPEGSTAELTLRAEGDRANVALYLRRRAPQQ